MKEHHPQRAAGLRHSLLAELELNSDKISDSEMSEHFEFKNHRIDVDIAVIQIEKDFEEKDSKKKPYTVTSDANLIVFLKRLIHLPRARRKLGHSIQTLMHFLQYPVISELVVFK
jgi:hypothetical protein